MEKNNADSGQEYARHVGRFIHEIGSGLLITHCPDGRLAVWPLVVAEADAPWKQGAQFPQRARFRARLEPDLVRQVTDCPRVGMTFQDEQRCCFLSGLAWITSHPAFALLEMEVLAAQFRALAGTEDLCLRSLDSARSR